MRAMSKPDFASEHAIAMGRRLRQARKAAGLSGDKLAARVGGDATKQKISRYETAQDRPPHLFLARLEKTVGITASWVITGTRAGLPGYILDKMPPDSD